MSTFIRYVDMAIIAIAMSVKNIIAFISRYNSIIFPVSPFSFFCKIYIPHSCSKVHSARRTPLFFAGSAVLDDMQSSLFLRLSFCFTSFTPCTHIVSTDISCFWMLYRVRRPAEVCHVRIAVLQSAIVPLEIILDLRRAASVVCATLHSIPPFLNSFRMISNSTLSCSLPS